MSRKKETVKRKTKQELVAESSHLREGIRELEGLKEQLLESEERLLQILRTLPTPILVTDSEGRIVLANEQAEALFGYEPKELLLRPIEILIPARLRERHVGHRLAYMNNPETRPMGGDLLLLGEAKDGTQFPVDVGLSPVRTQDGLLITCVIRELIERRGIRRNQKSARTKTTGRRGSHAREPGRPAASQAEHRNKPVTDGPIKSTSDEIRKRFDNDVDRFSDLETGQSATIDAPLVMQLICEAAARSTPEATRVLDIGCGAGNFCLKLLQYLPDLDFDLVDLSRPMLTRATERLRPLTKREIRTFQGDILELPLEPGRYDIVLAATVLHHLRSDRDWERVFLKVYEALKPSGSFWISDLVDHSIPQVHALLWERYGSYLTRLKDEEYRDRVFAYIAQEDTPRPVLYQTNLMRRVGFRKVEILHKNANYVAFGGIR